jgi:tetratricopeptide (TPR) repeat protein
MSKYNVDLDYVILNIDISSEELEEIKAEADKIISENKECNENLAIAYLKKAQCYRKLESWGTSGYIFYEGGGFISYEDNGIEIEGEDVIRLLEKALELSPNMPEALMQLGLINNNLYLAFDCHDELIKSFSRVIQLKPDYAAAYNNRAMVFYCTTNDLTDKHNLENNKIKFRNAICDLTEAIRLRPFDALYHLNRGIFHSRLGEHKEAIEDFSSAINYASDKLKEQLVTDVLIFDLRGKEYLELKEYEKAIEDFTESLRFLSDQNDELPSFFKQGSNNTFLLRGKAYYLAGEKEKAKTDFDEYLSLERKLADDAGRIEISNHIGVILDDI